MNVSLQLKLLHVIKTCNCRWIHWKKCEFIKNKFASQIVLCYKVLLTKISININLLEHSDQFFSRPLSTTSASTWLLFSWYDLHVNWCHCKIFFTLLEILNLNYFSILSKAIMSKTQNKAVRNFIFLVKVFDRAKERSCRQSGGWITNVLHW